MPSNTSVTTATTNNDGGGAPLADPDRIGAGQRAMSSRSTLSTFAQVIPVTADSLSSMARTMIGSPRMLPASPLSSAESDSCVSDHRCQRSFGRRLIARLAPRRRDRRGGSVGSAARAGDRTRLRRRRDRYRRTRLSRRARRLRVRPPDVPPRCISSASSRKPRESLRRRARTRDAGARRGRACGATATDRVRQHSRFGSAIRANAALASKGRAEQMLLDSDVPDVDAARADGAWRRRLCVARTAARVRSGRVAFCFAARVSNNRSTRATSSRRSLRRSNLPGGTTSRIDLAGPESLSRADLVQPRGGVSSVRAPLRVVTARAGARHRVARRNA